MKKQSEYRADAMIAQNILRHYGVKGMKWHKHLKRHEPDSDFGHYVPISGTSLNGSIPDRDKYEKKSLYGKGGNTEPASMPKEDNYWTSDRKTLSSDLSQGQKKYIVSRRSKATDNPYYAKMIKAYDELKRFEQDPNSKKRPQKEYIKIKEQLNYKVKDAMQNVMVFEENKKINREAKLLDEARTRVPSNVALKLRTNRIRVYQK